MSAGPTDQTLDKREGGVDTVYELGGHYNSLSKARIVALQSKARFAFRTAMRNCAQKSVIGLGESVDLACRDFFHRSYWKSIGWFVVIIIHLKTSFLSSCKDLWLPVHTPPPPLPLISKGLTCAFHIIISFHLGDTLETNAKLMTSFSA